MALIPSSNLEVGKLQYKAHWRYLKYVEVIAIVADQNAKGICHIVVYFFKLASF